MTIDALFRLEQVLRYVEDYGFLYSSFERLMRADEEARQRYGKRFPPRPWHNSTPVLRGLMLEAVAEKPSAHPGLRELMECATPLMLYNWCKSSRRIFRLSSDLQILLNATDVDRVGLSEISFPFGAFAIALEQPLVDAEGVEYDLITVMRDQPKEGMRFRHVFQIYAKQLSEYRPMSSIERNKIKEMCSRPRDRLRAERELLKLDARRALHVTRSASFASWQDESGSELEEDQMFTGNVGNVAARAGAGGKRGASTALTQAVRISLGFCLYLAMTDAAGRTDELVKREPLPSTLRGPRLVTDGAQVCLVQSMHVLTPEERQAFATTAAGGYELSPHFRRGYWSRPPGKGDDPDAVKTVWHRPTIVRRDVLPDGALPIGAQSRVK